MVMIRAYIYANAKPHLNPIENGHTALAVLNYLVRDAFVKKWFAGKRLSPTKGTREAPDLARLHNSDGPTPLTMAAGP